MRSKETNKQSISLPSTSSIDKNKTNFGKDRTHEKIKY